MRSMTRWGIALATAAAALLAVAPQARAQANNCMYNGREYPEGVVICQAGLRNLCMNGEWQSKEFCNGTPDGAVVGSNYGAARVIEVPVPVPVPAEPAAQAVDDD
jgi:hypothetical protein